MGVFMKTVNKTLVALVAGSLLTVGANANVYQQNTTAQPYFGVKAGQFDIDVNGADKATAYGVYAGYQFDQNVGVEAEYVGSEKADVNLTTASGATVPAKYDAKSYGVYGTYKYNFANTPVYAKGKLGLARSEFEAETTGVSRTNSDTGIAGGVGVGFKATPNFAIEAEYDYKSNDMNLWSIGANFKF